MRRITTIALAFATTLQIATASVSSVFTGADLYSRATEVVITENTNVSIVRTQSGWLLTFTPAFQRIIKGIEMPSSFVVSAPPQMHFPERSARDPREKFYALLLLRPSTNGPPGAFEFVGSDPEQMYVELDADENMKMATSFVDIVVTMLSSKNVDNQVQGLDFAGGLKDQRILDSLSSITRSGTTLEKGLAYKALVEMGETSNLEGLLTFLSSDGLKLNPSNYALVAGAVQRVKDEKSLSIMATQIGFVDAGLRERMFRAIFGNDPKETLRKAGRSFAQGDDLTALKMICSLQNRPLPVDLSLQTAAIGFWRGMYTAYHLGPNSLWMQ